MKTTKWAFRGRHRARIRLLFLAHTHTRAKIKHKVERYSRKNTILAHKYSLARFPIPSRACPQRATNSREKPSAQGRPVNLLSPVEKKKSTFGILPERDSRGILRSNVTISIAYLLHKVWDLFFRLPKDPVPFPFLPIVFYAQILK